MARVRSTLEEDLQTMVEHGHCICFEIVNGVLQYSNWFIHPYCPQHATQDPQQNGTA